MGSAKLLAPRWRWRQNLGTALSPQMASLLSRSLRTLPLRMQHQSASAQAITDGTLRLSAALDTPFLMHIPKLMIWLVLLAWGPLASVCSITSGGWLVLRRPDAYFSPSRLASLCRLLGSISR